jgi:hypothetical protein
MVFRQHSFASSGTTLRTISFESTGREGVYTKYKGRVRARVVCRWLLDETRGRRCGKCQPQKVRSDLPGQINEINGERTSQDE